MTRRLWEVQEKRQKRLVQQNLILNNLNYMLFYRQRRVLQITYLGTRSPATVMSVIHMDYLRSQGQ
jgi:hypothetical protein